MKNNFLQIRLSDRRMSKLREYSAIEDKTMTRVLEDFIDSLPTRSVGTPHAANNPVDQEQH
ncbi:hypothetical protein DP113_15340 [Brasilonema octagenarum UFV-E1]|uniref:Uncharacterized protein n=2 Tax=Brasilonema TaxID=383614 RepID=A0A856MPV3_9CYAN|nr:hypothetical protein [Brasilonema octagenarum UFV-OR1]QDL12264.1 hypothetical protein DP114_15400 [Brasilonema sennae CENA114]QDL18644.1 hypothetical protein DP113_15340 [Brasilonema octagenarum UFV-E1]